MTNMTKKRVQLNLYLVVTYREWQGDCLIQVPQNRGIHDKKIIIFKKMSPWIWIKFYLKDYS